MTNELKSEICTMEDDDEWYDRSITEYKALTMFEVDNNIMQMNVGAYDEIFMLGEKKSNVQILSLHKLPDTILEARQNKVVKSCYLKGLAGVFLDVAVKQMQALYGHGRLIATEVATPGLCSFSRSPGTDKIVKDSKRLAASCLIEPHFCQIDGETLILTKTAGESAYSHSLVGDSLHKLRLTEQTTCSSSSNVIPFGISGHSVALGVEDSGSTVIYDLRSHCPVVTIQRSASPAKWCFASSFQPIPPYNESTTVVLVSDIGSVAIYDLKYPTRPLLNGTVSAQPRNIRMSPNEKYLSVADSQGFVKIFSFSSEGIVEKFNHQGHTRMENSDPSTKIIDHIWYSDGTVISSADNQTVNIWQFNIPS